MRRRASHVPWIVLVALSVLAACQGGGGGNPLPRFGPAKPAASHAGRGQRIRIRPNQLSGSNGTVCLQTATPNPSQGVSAQFKCYLEPSDSIAFSSLTAEPDYHGNALPCSATTWTIGPATNLGYSAVPGLTADESPPTTDSSSNCQRIDTNSVTLTTSSTLSNSVAHSVYTTEGTFTFENPPNSATCGNCESTGWWDLYPGLHIKDVDEGKYVENTSVKRVAGQHIDLQAWAPDSSALSSCKWTIPSPFPNDAVDSYAWAVNPGASPPSSWSTPKPSSASLTNTTLQFYWINAQPAGDVKVTCTLSNGAKLTAKATYTVIAPATTVTASYGSPGANDNYPPNAAYCNQTATYLYFGNPCTTPGIKWQYKATATAKESGSITMLQLINRNTTGTNEGSPPTPYSDTTNNASWADNGEPYSSPVTLPASSSAAWSDLDAPATYLADKTALEMHDIFDDYFMYKPDDDSSGASIWVTLNHLTWSYDISTTWNATTGFTDPPTVHSESLPVTAPTYTALPVWNGLYLNQRTQLMEDSCDSERYRRSYC